MMNYILIFAFSILAFSCTNENENSATVKETKVKKEITNPCELISQQSIEDIFSIENEVTKKEPTSKTFPTCIYKWNANKKGEKEIGNQMVSYDQENTVMIVLGSTSADSKKFKTSTSVYKDAVEVDITEKALWSDKMHQLTIMEKGNLIHINVEYFDAVDQQKAKSIELAKIIIAQL
ncbi:MAG: hypothetical protein WED10_11925 [Brumimicrobium sp.]